MTIFIDHRERPSGIPTMLEKMGVPVSVVELEIGDYVIGEIPVERKEVGDYLSSKTSGHLDEQLYNMSASFDLSYLIIEGNISLALQYRKMKRAPYISSLVGSSFKRAPDGRQGQIITVNLDTRFDTALFLKFMHEKIANGEARLPKMFKRGVGKGEILIHVVSSIPGIGNVRSKSLLEQFKTIKRITEADVNQLSAVIGQAHAKKVFDLLNSIYGGE